MVNNIRYCNLNNTDKLMSFHLQEGGKQRNLYSKPWCYFFLGYPCAYG